MHEPIVVEPPPTLPLIQLLARRDAPSLRELATLVREMLEGPFFRNVADAPFTLREVDLRRTSPTFPTAIVISDGLDSGAPTMPSASVAVDRDAFLAASALLASGRVRTVEEVLALAAASVNGASAQAWPAIDACVRAIARVVLDAIRAMVPPVDDLRPLLAHHTAPDGASIFVARDAALNSPDINAPLEGGFSWAIAARLTQSRVRRHRVVYEVGDEDPSALLFSVGISKEGALRLLLRPGTGSVLEVAARVDAMFERFVKLVAVVRFAPHTRLSLWVDDVLVGSARAEASNVRRLVGRQSIGAGILGLHRSSLFYRELVLVGSPASATTRACLSRRLERHTLR